MLGRLKFVEAGHDLDRRCMEGTRQSVLNRIVAWVAVPQEKKDTQRRNMYWFYGSPGIGKTSLAHSICANLHDQRQLAGAFFCRRDDPNLSDPRNILPSLTCKLAGIFPAFRAIVANRLRNDLNLTSKSMKHALFLDFIRKLPRHPKHALVFVIDALDECGDDQSRSVLLKALLEAAEHSSWLKIIITSRPEVDIQRSFGATTRYDLGADQDAKVDLQTFTRSQFNLMASKWHLPASWPEESLFNRVVNQANGLFIFIKTFVLALEQCEDPKESLEATLKGSAGTGMEALYGLYSNILEIRLVHSNIAWFRRMIGVLLATAQNRSLCEETIAIWLEYHPILSKSGWMTSALCFTETRRPMEGFVCGICQFPSSSSVIIANTKSLCKMHTCSWALLALRRWSNNFVSISAGLRIPSSPMHRLKISQPSSSRTFPMRCNTVRSIGQIISALLPTIAIGAC